MSYLEKYNISIERGDAGSKPPKKWWDKKFNEKFENWKFLAPLKVGNLDGKYESVSEIKDFISLVERRTIEDVIERVEKIRSDVNTMQIGSGDYQAGKISTCDELLSTLRGLIK